MRKFHEATFGSFVDRLTRSRLGATMLEAVLVIPLLFALIFIIIDLSRFSGVQGVVSQGAQRGLDLAVKLPDLDLPLGSTDQKFIKARTKVINEAEKIAKGTLVGDYNQVAQSSHFIGFENYLIWNGTSVASATVNSVLLRPGECRTSKAGVLYCHPTICPPAPQSCNSGGRPWSNTSDSMENLLKTEPLVVVMPATFKAVLPIPYFSSAQALGKAAGFKEIFSSGAYPIPPDVPASTATPSPTPTITPTFPPGYTPPPTATALPSATPTNTPLPCNPTCNSASILNNCVINHDMSCAVCNNGTCVCTNDCSTGG